MSPFIGYVVASALVPVGLPLLVAWLYTRIHRLRFRPHLLLGGGQLCFFSITLSLINISQVVAVRGRDGMKPWAAIVLGFIAILAAAVWVIGIAETVGPGVPSDETKVRITRYSAYVAGAAIIGGGMFRWLAGLF